MTVPTFSRIEIRADDAVDLVAASRELSALSRELNRIAASVPDGRLLRLAAHDAIRDTSSRLRARRSPTDIDDTL